MAPLGPSNHVLISRASRISYPLARPALHPRWPAIRTCQIISLTRRLFFLSVTSNRRPIRDIRSERCVENGCIIFVWKLKRPRFSRSRANGRLWIVHAHIKRCQLLQPNFSRPFGKRQFVVSATDCAIIGKHPKSRSRFVRWNHRSVARMGRLAKRVAKYDRQCFCRCRTQEYKSVFRFLLLLVFVKGI